MKLEFTNTVLTLSAIVITFTSAQFINEEDLIYGNILQGNGWKVKPANIDNVSEEDLHNFITSVDILLQNTSRGSFIRTALNVLGGIEVSNNGSLPSQQCSAAIFQILEGIYNGNMWAVAFVDTAGKLPSSVLQGNFNWLGDYEGCLNISVPDSLNFTGQFAYAAVGLSKPIPMKITLSMCVPNVCSNEDIGAIIQRIFAIEYALDIKIMGLLGVQKVLLELPPFNTATIALICVLGFISSLIVIGTCYDILFYQRRPGGAQKIPIADVNGPTNYPAEVTNTGEVSVVAYTPLLDSHTNELEPQIRSKSQQVGDVASKLLLAFSLQQNVTKLLTVPPASDSNLQVIHGIRFLSMTWVILGHTFAFIISTGGTSIVANPTVFYTYFNRWTFQAILNATVSVDSFFLISGTLVAYLLLRELENVGGVRQLRWGWLKFYLHRYWRLTPSYMLLVWIWTCLYQYMGDGPLWPRTPANAIAGPCNETWWTNALYLNNVVHQDKQCFGWAWYLANDMQFYIISPLFIIPLFVMWKLGVGLVVLGIFGCLLTRGLLSDHYNSPFDLWTAMIQKGTDPDVFNHMYIVPWTRIGPYLVGLGLGFVLFKTKLKCKIHPALVCLGWLLAAASALSMIYGPYNIVKGHLPSKALTAFYVSTHRTVWGACLAWVIFACIHGYGGFVNRLLSWSALVPLSRLTYMAYLVHPAVIFNFYLTRKQLFMVDDFLMIYIFLGTLVMSYMVAFVVSMTLEAPLLGIEKVILKKK